MDGAPTTSQDGADAHAAIGRGTAYLIAGRRVAAEAREFADAIVQAYERHERPRCLCLVEGVEMYIARLAGQGGGYIVKRMPESGSRHAPDCPSYEPPPESSGLGQVLGTAITEDPATGETTLRLDFPLSKIAGRSAVPSAGADSDSAASGGIRLSLRGLLHYLWDQAELTRWRPGFAGKRTWATVRARLLQAAEHKLARGEALRARLYVPEVFSVEERDVINARRLAQWQHAVAAPGKPQHLMLLIGEVKEIVPARYGYKAVVKHVPDQAFAIDEQLYRRLGRSFEPELAMWGAADDIHMVMIATFGVSGAGVPAIHELCLMALTRQWLPVEDGFEKQLVDRLVGNGRSFIKGLRLNMPRGRSVATATLTDAGDAGTLMFVAQAGLASGDVADGSDSVSLPGGARVWMWRPASEAIPGFPEVSSSRHDRGRHESAANPRHLETDMKTT